MTTAESWDEGEEEASIWQKSSRKSWGETILGIVVTAFAAFVIGALIMFFPPVFVFKDCDDGTTRRKINTLLGFYYSIVALVGFLLLSILS